MTQIAIEMKINDPATVLETIQSSFALFRKMVGPHPSMDKEETTASLRRVIPNEHRPSTPKNSVTSNPNLAYISHNIRIYEIQITLWLTVSSVYRSMDQLEKSNTAVQEAERILLLLSVQDQRVRHTVSRLFQKESSTGSTRGNKPTKTTSNGYLKDSNPILSRIEADIALEVSNVFTVESVHQIS